MHVRYTPFLISVLAWCALLNAASPSAEGTPATSGVLPHPDILQLPPESPHPKTVEAQAAPAELKESTPAAPAMAQTAAPVAAVAGSEEAKEIARRPGTASATRTIVNETGEVQRRGLASSRSFLADLWPLLVVLALVGVMAWLVKRFLPARRLLTGSDVLQIVARTSVSPKQQLMLVKLGRRMLLLGVSPDRMSALTCVDDPDQVALLMGEVASRKPDSMTKAFSTSIETEVKEYDVLGSTDETDLTHGQVRGLLQKVRQLAGKN